jgi:hypothetical protein
LIECLLTNPLRIRMKKRITLIAGWIIAVVLVCVLVIRGCRIPGPADEAELVGNYIALSDKDRYFLELRANNTYSQRIVRADGSELTNIGHWESGYSDTEPRIKLSNFKSFWAGQPQNAGLCNAYVSRTLLGRTQLEFREEKGGKGVRSLFCIGRELADSEGKPQRLPQLVQFSSFNPS